MKLAFEILHLLRLSFLPSLCWLSELSVWLVSANRRRWRAIEGFDHPLIRMMPHRSRINPDSELDPSHMQARH